MPATIDHREAHRGRRGGLFWKLVAAYAALSLVLIAVLAALLVPAYRATLLRSFDDRLQAAAATAAALIADRWPISPSVELQDLVRRMAKEDGVRMTIISAAGRVLADSRMDDLQAVLDMDNHRNRIEVIEALRSGVGSARRISSTNGEQDIYHAVRVDQRGIPQGVVRTSITTHMVDAEMSAFRRRLIAYSLIALSCSTAAAAWFFARAIHPLGPLTAAADALTAGQYEPRFPLQAPRNDDFGAIERALTEASKRLARGARQLQSTTQTQSTVLEGMSESVIAIDRSEHVLFANASAGRMLGFQPDKVEGLSLLEAVRSHELREAVHRALQSKRPANCEMLWRAGPPRTFDVLATPLPGDPPPGVVLVLRDISELKRLERMRQQFVANVSHELKTPLSSIKAYTETLLSGARNDPAHCERFLHGIEEQAGRLQDLILDMLSLARIESGQAAFDFADVSVARVVRRCLVDYEPLAVARDVALDNQARDAAIRVHADEEALRQILSNLIDNAIKYTPAGGRVSVRCQANGKLAEIEVSDTGQGIPAEHLPHVFERFYRVDKARSRELGGTGLGLSIVKHLCQAMGGSVAVSSVVHQGSTFTARLPLSAPLPESP